jgi:hypothetical protein
MKDLEKLIRLQSFLKSYIQTKKQNEQINIKLIGIIIKRHLLIYTIIQ